MEQRFNEGLILCEHANGEITSKKKLVEKQKGRARLREYGNVSFPQEAYIAALRMGEE